MIKYILELIGFPLYDIWSEVAQYDNSYWNNDGMLIECVCENSNLDHVLAPKVWWGTCKASDAQVNKSQEVQGAIDVILEPLPQYL